MSSSSDLSSLNYSKATGLVACFKDVFSSGTKESIEAPKTSEATEPC